MLGENERKPTAINGSQDRKLIMKMSGPSIQQFSGHVHSSFRYPKRIPWQKS
jgi:hypothetical protein